MQGMQKHWTRYREQELFKADSNFQQMMGAGWTAFRLQRMGEWNEENMAKFPITTSIIKSLNIPMILGRDYPAGRKAAGCPPSPFHHSSGVHCTQQFELESDSFRTNMKVVLRGL